MKRDAGDKLWARNARQRTSQRQPAPREPYASYLGPQIGSGILTAGTTVELTSCERSERRATGLGGCSSKVQQPYRLQLTSFDRGTAVTCINDP